MSTVTQAPDRITDAVSPAGRLLAIGSRLQKTLVFEIVVLLGNLYAVFVMIGATYAMATEDGFTGVNLYFGYLADGSGVAALVAAEVLTVVLAIRTWQMLHAANSGDIPTLKRLSSAGWATVAIFSSYIATGVMLLKVNEMIRALDAEVR